MNEMDEVLQTFVAEARELLQGMEESLLVLEQSPQDGEAIAATFRAMHTIKGSAGLFSLDELVGFTHHAESLLDRVRHGEVTVDADLIALLLQCGDQIARMVAVTAGDAGPSADDDRTRPALLAQLQNWGGGISAPAMPVNSPAPIHASTQAGQTATVDNPAWHLSLRFHADVLRNGMDPSAFLRYLATLGRIVAIHTLWEHLPAADEMDPESCYLGFELDLESAADFATIDGTFDFVRDDCGIVILPPHAQLEAYRALLAGMGDEAAQLLDTLRAIGSLSAAEADLLEADETGADRVETVETALPVTAAVTTPAEARPETRHSVRFVRVDASKLEDLINQVGELVIAGTSASLLAQQGGHGMLIEAMAQVARQVEEIRDRALSLRMVEIGESFNRFPRVVRDISRELGKDIELVITGADTELDKTVVEKIGDPLMHLVRNAMDHGIEPTEERLAAGKSPRGRVRLNAYHESGSIVIEVSDDGGGLRRERILAKAQERGLVQPGQLIADRDVFALIFEAGFSTADAVTNLSGRGVGMDVVKRNISALRGHIEIDSVAGQGTTIRIRLPLTLAIIDGFLIQVGDSAFVIPLDIVQECLELPLEPGSIQARSSHYLDLRGEALPYVRLAQLLKLEGPRSERQNVVVVQCGGLRAGLVVDHLLGEFQTVIKPLGQMFRQLKGFSGSTILGSGEVALILDVPALIRTAAERETQVLKHTELVGY